MTLSEFKTRIAQRFETYADNLVISVGDKEYRGNDSKVDEAKLNIQNDLNINEHTVVKVTFKKQLNLQRKDFSNKRSKSKGGYSSSVVVTTTINNLNENAVLERFRGVSKYK